MNDGSETQVQCDFKVWLKSHGWEIMPKAKDDHIDVRARRAANELIAEVKGHTSSPGLDLDTAYGQLLRRMTTDDPNVLYAIVVPAAVCKAAERVPAWVHELLRITVYLVDRDGTVRSLPDANLNSR